MHKALKTNENVKRAGRQVTNCYLWQNVCKQKVKDIC